ncbi:hypothetical protein ABPG77_001513 [Micractinium sp. CCAP 211/92]
MADTYVSPPSPQSNAASPARFDSWLPGSSSSSGGGIEPPAPTPESVAGVTAAPPATAALSSDSIYGSAVSPVLLLAGLLVLSVVLSSVLFGMVFFLTRRLRARRALRLAGSVNGGGPAGGPQMPLAQHLSGRVLGGGAALPQPCTVVVQPDMSVSLCVKDDSSCKDAEQAGAAAPMQTEDGGSGVGAARHEAASAGILVLDYSGRIQTDISMDFGLLGPPADDLSETSSEADTPPPRVFATPWAPAWTPFWYVAGRQRRRRHLWAQAPRVQGPPAPLEVVDVRHMTEP